jgi:hypothetical protein
MIRRNSSSQGASGAHASPTANPIKQLLIWGLDKDYIPFIHKEIWKNCSENVTVPRLSPKMSGKYARSQFVTKDMMFFCIPQQAYMRTENCCNLRKRPAGKAPAGAQPMLRACEKCTMYPLVDKEKVPTVSLDAYLGGSKPKVANIHTAANKKLIQAELSG